MPSSSSARPAATCMPRPRASSSTVSSRRVLPMPASPSMSHDCAPTGLEPGQGRHAERRSPPRARGRADTCVSVLAAQAAVPANRGQPAYTGPVGTAVIAPPAPPGSQRNPQGRSFLASAAPHPVRLAGRPARGSKAGTSGPYPAARADRLGLRRLEAPPRARPRTPGGRTSRDPPSSTTARQPVTPMHRTRVNDAAPLLRDVTPSLPPPPTKRHPQAGLVGQHPRRHANTSLAAPGLPPPPGPSRTRPASRPAWPLRPRQEPR